MLIVRNEVSRPARRNGVELPAEKGPDGRNFGVPDRVYSVASWHGPRQPAIEKRSRTSTFRGVVIWRSSRKEGVPTFSAMPTYTYDRFVAFSGGIQGRHIYAESSARIQGLESSGSLLFIDYFPKLLPST